MSNMLPFPIIIPLLTAVSMLFFWRRPLLQKFVGLAGAGALTGSSVVIYASVWRHGILATQIGGWPAPHGITLAADVLSALLVLATSLVVCAVSVASFSELDRERERFGYYPLLHFLTMGICGSFLTGDIFNLYVWFEVMLIASFVLLSLGGERVQLEGTIKYVAMNLIASTFFLAGIGVLYGTVGTLNMADLAQQLRSVQEPAMVSTLSIFFLLAFGIKAAIFPLFFWLPASYHTPPFPVSAIFAGLLTKVGIYALLRFFTLFFGQEPGPTHHLILILSVPTMLVGILGAMVQKDYRRIASFILISHIGVILAGLGLFTALGVVGAVFYLVHDMLAKTGLFLFTGILQRLGGHTDITRLGGFYRAYPGISGLFFVLALAVSGVPPFSGFWGKLLLIQAGLQEKHHGVVAAILVSSLLTLYAMMKIWSEVFWKSSVDPGRNHGAAPGEFPRLPRTLLLPVAGLVLATILIGLRPASVYEAAAAAARQLLQPDLYIQAVLGGEP